MGLLQELATRRILKMDVVIAVAGKFAKFHKCGNQRVKLFDVAEADVDTKAPAGTAELGIRADDR
jgi:hypothetical protein